MKYFVSADIHGFYDEWMQALAKEKFDANNPDHKLIVCGDLFDRGTQAKELQDFVLRMLEQDKIILVRGNHEELALDLIENYIYYMLNITTSQHWRNGTFQTLLDLTGMTHYEAVTALLAFQRNARETDYVKKIIPAMKDYYETERYIFVHAWIPLKNGGYSYDKDWRRAGKRRWSEARWQDPVDSYNRGFFPKNKTLVFGHWHCSAFWKNQSPEKYDEYGERALFEPFFGKGIIALDACTAVTKKVNVVLIED